MAKRLFNLFLLPQDNPRFYLFVSNGWYPWNSLNAIFEFSGKVVFTLITLFKSIPVFSATHSILRNIPHIWSECEEYSAKYCESHRPLLWI